MTLDATLIAVTVTVVFVFYLPYTHRHFGKLPSISASAKYFKRDGRSPLFYLFISGLVVPMTYLSYNYYMIFAGMLLFGIGMITGYNPQLKENKLQDTLHVLLTNGAIGLYLAGMIIFDVKEKQYWDILLIILAGVPSVYMLVKRVKYRTRKIEVLVIIAVILSMILNRLILTHV